MIVSKEDTYIVKTKIFPIFLQKLGNSIVRYLGMTV